MDTATLDPLNCSWMPQLTRLQRMVVEMRVGGRVYFPLGTDRTTDEDDSK